MQLSKKIITLFTSSLAGLHIRKRHYTLHTNGQAVDHHEKKATLSTGLLKAQQKVCNSRFMFKYFFLIEKVNTYQMLLPKHIHTDPQFTRIRCRQVYG